MYQECFDLIVQYVYGNPEVLTTYQELVVTNLATYLSVFMVAVPFLACFASCRLIFGR